MNGREKAYLSVSFKSVGFFFSSYSKITRAVLEQVHYLSGQKAGLCHRHLTDLSGLSEER